MFGNSFGGGGPPREPSPFAPGEAGPTDTSGGVGASAGGLFGNASPFGQPPVQGADADEPPIPSYALGRRTSVSAESLVPQAQRSLAPALDSTTEEDEEGESNANQHSIPNFPKNEAQLARIRAAIKPNFLFRNLDEEQEADVLAAMKEVQIGAGEMIIEQGAAGDFFYVVEKGELEVFVKKEGQMIDADKGDRQLLGKKVATCVEGNSFGELALMHK
jgi:cAMP-dependent protein kinase regulator